MKKILFILLVSAFSGAIRTQSLPNLKEDYRQLSRWQQEGKVDSLVDYLSIYNGALRSPTMAIHAAWRLAKLGSYPEAADQLLRALDYGLTNSNVIEKYDGLEVVKDQPEWPEIERRLSHLSKQTSDIDHFAVSYEEAVDFWETYEKAREDTTQAHAYFEDYILNGSPGLRDFYFNRYLSVYNIVHTVFRKYPEYYAYLHERFDPEKLQAIREETVAHMRRFQQYYPAAVFPKGFLVVGVLNSGGSVTELGVYIGLDMYGRSEDMPQAELSDWHKSVLNDYSGIAKTLTHELMHFQQNYRDTMLDDNVLLRKVIQEGVCDFLVELTGKEEEIKPKHYDFFQKHEEQLLQEFKEEMYSTDLSKWMYNGDIEDRPSDLGYTLGHLITKSYFENAEDKQQAVYELLNTDDFEGILRGSQYGYLLGQ